MRLGTLAALIPLGCCLYLPFGLLTPIVSMLGDGDAEPPMVSSEALQKLVTTESLKARAETLNDCANESTELLDHPTRLIGTPGHEATLKYIEQTLNDLDGYYKVERQGFTAITGTVHNFSLVEDGSDVVAKPMQMTPSTNGVVTAKVVEVGKHGCLGLDYDNVRGQIALVRRGGCGFGEKSEFAGLAGAKALLVWDPEQKEDGEPISGSLSLPLEHQVPTVAVQRRWAEGAVGKTVELDVDAEVTTTNTFNILAETVDGDHDNVVMLGAHSDSVGPGPGLNDDGSGTLSLLEVATQLARFNVKNAVRFAWWSAEEEGLKGSLHYTTNISPTDASKIRLFMDYDMMASPNFAYQVYNSDDRNDPHGSSALRKLYVDYYDAHGLNHTLQPFDGRSDYVGFLEIGIPAGGFDTGAEAIKTPEEQDMFGGTVGEQLDPCYHASCDGLDNLDYDAWIVNTKLIAHSVASYAESLEGFPLRNNDFLVKGRQIRRPIRSS